jgi:large subunit ribosomal protein L37e
MGKMNKTTHIACQRCGSISYHRRHKVCSACGFGRSTRIRGYRWVTKRPKNPTH